MKITKKRNLTTVPLAAALLAGSIGLVSALPASAAPPSGDKPSVPNPASATNGWGPISVDQSNGERGSNDGRTLSIGGTQYAEGLGVHSNSDVRYKLNGYCQGVSVSVGVDDEVGDRGSVRFWIRVDGKTVFKTGVVRGSDGPRDVYVPTNGATDLQLLVTDAGDGTAYDHADWGDLFLVCD